MAWRVRPAPLSGPSVPLLTRTSASENPLGASLKVKLINAVAPAFTRFVLALMSRVGASVSIAISGVVPLLPVLPAGSV